MKNNILLVAILATSLSFGQNIFPTSGNVGIGTTNPADKLDVKGAIFVQSTNGNYNENLRLFPSTSNDYSSIALGAVAGNSGTGIGQWTFVRYPLTDNHMFSIRYNSSDYLNITNNGNVGIGTTNPSARLDINGSVKISNGSSISFDRGNSDYSTIVDSYGYPSQGYSVNGGSYWLRFASKGGTHIILNTDGGVGSPENNFDHFTVWQSNVDGDKLFRITNIGNTFIKGNLGIGTTNPTSKLDVNGVIQTYNKDTSIATWDNVRIWSEGESGVIEANGDENGLTIRSNTGNKILLMSNVGIGTQNPDSKLTVNGNIHAKEVKVDLNVPAPDYVFTDDYKLKSLKEVEVYINKNNHLPEIPSAKEFEKNGVLLAEMNMKLLKKVEELTLYAIEQDKKISTKSNEIEGLKKDFEVSKKEIEILKKDNEIIKVLAIRLAKMETQIKEK